MGLPIVRHDLMTKQQQPSSEADPKVHNDTSGTAAETSGEASSEQGCVRALVKIPGTFAFVSSSSVKKMLMIIL